MIRVDPPQPCIPKGRWRWVEVSHLFDDSDDVEALHAFAKRIGLKRSWFQPHPRLDHYDLSPNMREKAVRFGAVEATREETVQAMKRVDKKSQPQ